MAQKVQPLEDPAVQEETGVSPPENVPEVAEPEATEFAPEHAEPALPLEVDEAAADDVAKKSPRRPREKKPSNIAEAERSEAASVGLAVELDAELDARFEAYRLSTRISYHHIVLDAVEQTYADLPALVAKALGRDVVERPVVSLFGRTTAPAPINTEGKKERFVHTIRLTLSRRSMLDQIAAEVHAPSRNFMICVALDEFLPQQ